MSESQFEIIADASEQLAAAFVDDSREKWIGSPFEWILHQPSRRRGAIGERLVAEWCERNGMVVKRSTSSDADRVINGHKIEVKFSSLWTSNLYKFQQIRDQDYSHLLCLGISPHEAHSWFIPKDVLHQYVIGHMGQHTGATGTDTAWLTVKPHQIPEWLEPFGSRLEDVKALMLELGKGSF